MARTSVEKAENSIYDANQNYAKLEKLLMRGNKVLGEERALTQRKLYIFFSFSIFHI